MIYAVRCGAPNCRFALRVSSHRPEAPRRLADSHASSLHPGLDPAEVTVDEVTP